MGPLAGPTKSALTLGRPRLQPPPLGLGPGGGGLLTVQVQATMDKEVKLTPLAPPDGPHPDAPERLPTGRQEAPRLKVRLERRHHVRRTTAERAIFPPQKHGFLVPRRSTVLG